MGLKFLRLGLQGPLRFKRRVILDTNVVVRTAKRRVIYMPNDSMRALHERLILALRQSGQYSRYATGGVPGGSPVRNVEPHRGNRYFYLLDIHHAYPSANLDDLARILVDRGILFEDDVVAAREFLEQYCSAKEGGLATGAPASPDLYNLLAGTLLDSRLEDLCAKYRLTYTRYLDDLTFSAQHHPIGRKKRAAIARVITAAGFHLSHHKTRVADLRKGPIVITGVGLTLEGRMFIPRHFLRRAYGLLHRAINTGDVPHDLIAGVMGTVFSVTDWDNPNATEQRVLDKYLSYRRARG